MCNIPEFPKINKEKPVGNILEGTINRGRTATNLLSDTGFELLLISEQ